MNITSGTLDIVNSDGSYLVREVFSIVFYIRRPHADVGRLIEDAIWRFANLVSFEQLRLFSDADGEWQDLLERDLSQWLEEHYGSFSDTINASIFLRGRGYGAADFYLRYSGDMRAGEEGFASYFKCWVPKDFWIEHRHQLIAFANDLAKTLPIGSGYATLSIAGDDPRRLQRLAIRYLALDISYPGAVKLDIGDKASGSYWITYFGQVLTEALHGVTAMQKALPKEIVIDEMRNGICRLQLGPEPILGDVNLREDVSLYRALASYLDRCGALHIPKRVVYFQDDAGLSDRDTQDEWHRRFVG